MLGLTDWRRWMSDRAALITRFLAQSGHDGWTRQAIAADASARQYTRLTQDGASVILMDVPPASGEDLAPFITMARYLVANGCSAPEILAEDRQNNLLLLSDLGPIDVARWIDRYPQDSEKLYRASTDILLHLASLPPPALHRMTPEIAGEMIAITGPHYARRPIPDLVAAVTDAMRNLTPAADTLALRDYHAENLIWRADETGLARIGLLDFQDAFIAPEGYDLASLLRDVRRDVPDGICDAMIAHYTSARHPHGDFTARLACLGAQRNLRILGVFARLARDMGKTRYVPMIPRVWSALHKDLAHPALAPLRALVARDLPEPDTAFLAELAA
jgi:aminoglycoside/choline kinase family phosphotransferase